MSSIDFYDPTLFGNDAGEDEDPAVLDSYFVTKSEFNKFLSTSVSLCVAKAKKGMGKSALLSRMAYSLEKTEENIVIKVTGNDLLGLGDFEGKDQAYLENYWKRIICRRIAIELGQKIGVALSDDAMSLVEVAEYEGYKQKNVVSSILSRIKLSLSFNGLSMEVKQPSGKSELLGVVDRYLTDSGKKTVWMLIDDIDATYVDTPDYQARIGSFFGALRAIIRELQGVKIRATVRSDVWTNLRKVEHLDKWHQYIVDIVWDDDSLRRMLSRKILSYVNRNGLVPGADSWDPVNDYDKITDLVFVENFPWDGRMQKCFIPLKVFSAGRPRWMGQLSRKAGEQCANEGDNKIDIDHIKDVLQDFGLNRVDDLMKEHSHQFPHVDKLVDVFRGNKRGYKLSELISLIDLRYIKSLNSDDVPKLDGVGLLSASQLGAFLYRIGFLSGRLNDRGRWLLYNEQPDYFETSNNKQDKVSWYVHPSYRAYLGIFGQVK